MLLALLLPGCTLLSGPQDALLQAREAVATRDLAAFEQAVDLDAVAPGIVKLCGAANLRKDYVDQQFQPPHPLGELIERMGKPWLMSMLAANGEGLAQEIREQWAELEPAEACPGVHFGEPSFRAAWTARDSGLLELPLEMQGVATSVVLDVKPVGEGWRITGLDADAALAAHEAELKARARKAAQARAKELDAKHPENWAALRAYLLRNPEEAEIQATYEAAAEPFLAAQAPLAVTGVHIAQEGFLKMKRVVRPGVRNTSGREVSGYRLRVSFLGDQGEPVISTAGEEAVVVAVSAYLPPDAGDASGQVITRPIEWPTLAQAQAVPVEVSYADGEVWVHPAVEAGIWTR
ncbi:MAG: hypothetical protein KC708_22620 [Anaerolineae bacterium]|nr:hypothetical protein [Anaerolineae bacterium]